MRCMSGEKFHHANSSNLDAFSHIAYFHRHTASSYLCLGNSGTITSFETTAIENIASFLDAHSDQFVYGYVSYDAKNGIESLSSNNTDNLGFPVVYFCVPMHVFEVRNQHIVCVQGENTKENLRRMNHSSVSLVHAFNSRISKREYIDTVQQLQQHIQQGDIYEINFCQEYFSTHNTIADPIAFYGAINNATQAPYSCYLREGNRHVFCGSPERYLQKQGTKLSSHPIKGTAPRGKSTAEDVQLSHDLQTSTKERSENVMIVDLVRNDLSKLSQKGSVHVDEFVKLYSFKTVHQLISTISCKLKENTSFTDVLKATFPMGSMTGCPKVKAMQLSEQYEKFRRGLYSGTIGYFLPNGDFDFNVVIRTILYNHENGYLSCAVGGAITIDSDPEIEYAECETKIKKLISSIGKIHVE